MFQLRYDKLEAQELARKLISKELSDPQALSDCDFYISFASDVRVLAFGGLLVDGIEFKIGTLKG